MNILLIEDNLDVLENTTELLELAGYNVLAVENGKKGILKAKESIPDIILCDIMMPEMDGYEVLYMLSIDPKTSTIPFIFLTAKSEQEDFRKGMELGADDYIIKPFEEIDLLKAIERRLNKSKLIKATFDRKISEADISGFSLKDGEGNREIFENKRLKKFPAKSFVFLQHGQPIYLYYVRKGKVKTFKTNDEGKELITGLYKERDFFGYHSLLKDAEYSDSAIVVKDCELDLIPKEDFYEMLRTKREIATEFIKMLSYEVVEKEKELLSLAYNSVKKRVADSILKYFEKYGESMEQKGMQIPRDDLANLAGTSTESVIRTLSEFKKDGLISVEGKTIYIKKKIELENYRY